MMSPVTEEYAFYWPSPWRKLSIWAVVSVVAIVGGMGLGAVAQEVVEATESVFPAVLIGLVAVILDLYGLVVLFVVMERLVCHGLPWREGSRLVMVYVRPDCVWIYRGVELFPKTDLIAYPAIVWVRMEHASRGRQCIRIVHGPDLDTVYIDEMRPGDYERLLAQLEERCPKAFTPTPPPNYQLVPYPQRTQPTDHLLADSAASHVFPFGPKMSGNFIVAIFINILCIAIGMLFCWFGILGGILGFWEVPAGSCVLFVGVALFILASKFKWWRLLAPVIQGKRRHEIRLASDRIWISHSWCDSFSGQEKPIRIVFGSIREIRRDTARDAIRIIYGSSSDVEWIPRRWMESAEFDELFARLREYVPTRLHSSARPDD